MTFFSGHCNNDVIDANTEATYVTKTNSVLLWTCLQYSMLKYGFPGQLMQLIQLT
jgi:hypothetical protein